MLPSVKTASRIKRTLLFYGKINSVGKAEEGCKGEKQMSEINEWYMNIQNIVDDIDRCIKSGEDEKLTLGRMSQTLGYSEYYVSRKFSEISGMKLRDYMRYRRLAFALRKLRDTDKGILDTGLILCYIIDTKRGKRQTVAPNRS